MIKFEWNSELRLHKKTVKYSIWTKVQSFERKVIDVAFATENTDFLGETRWARDWKTTSNIQVFLIISPRM